MKKHSGPSRTRTWAILVVASIAVFQVQLIMAPAGSAATGVCDAAFSGSPVGTLAISATVPNGGNVSPGQTVDMTITWDPADWVDLDQFHNCFQINGVTDDSLTYTEKPPANDGIINDSVVIPSSLKDGDEVCVRSRLSGQPTGGNTSTQKGNKLCWNVKDKPQDPDVKISKSASSTSVVSGDTVTFTLTVDNTGTGDALDVEVVDTIASGMTIASAAGCTITDPKVTCDLGTIPAGGSKSVTITVKAEDGACPSVQNNATVSASNEPNANKGNNTSNTVTINVDCPTPDVKISKSASTASVNVDGSVTFTLTVENVGGATAKDVVVTDTIPAGMTITSAAGCTITGQNVTCPLGDIAKNASKSVDITVKATAAACPEVTNDATVSASNEPGSATGNNNSNVVRVDVICPDPDVEIRKADDAPVGGIAPGEPFTYTITVENVGGATATDVRVADTIPDHLTITSAAGCTIDGQNVTCQLGDLDAGQKKSVTITVEASEDACPQVTNNATVSASNEPDPNKGNNTSNDVTTLINCVEPGIAVRIVKTNDANRDGNYSDNEEARRPGADVPFLLVVTNTGEADWKITDLTDSFDATTIDLLDNKCSDLKGLSLAPGESVTCKFTLNNYSPPADEVLVNEAKVCVVEMGGNRTDCDKDPSRVRSRDVLGQTITPTKTPPGGTAFTGSGGTLGFGALALALMLFGSWLVWAGYRRRTLYDS